jgi:hypothetical protein
MVYTVPFRGIIDLSHLDNTAPSCLLLGVFYTDTFRSAGPQRGQVFRDGIRTTALQQTGYSVHTLDNKHIDANARIHCNADFTDCRRMHAAMRKTFGEDKTFDHIILDYFFSPSGWARERWSAKFWSHTINYFATHNILAIGGKIWLPNMICVRESLQLNSCEISAHYITHEITDALANPLCAATETVTEELLQCPDALTNETQLRTLSTDVPFLCLLRIR